MACVLCSLSVSVKKKENRAVNSETLRKALSRNSTLQGHDFSVWIYYKTTIPPEFKSLH